MSSLVMKLDRVRKQKIKRHFIPNPYSTYLSNGPCSSDAMKTQKGTLSSSVYSWSCLVRQGYRSVITASAVPFCLVLRTTSYHQICDDWMLFSYNVITVYVKQNLVCYHLLDSCTFGNISAFIFPLLLIHIPLISCFSNEPRWADGSGHRVQFDCLT